MVRRRMPLLVHGRVRDGTAMSAFRDEIANALACSDIIERDADSDTPDRHADTLLAMPEMQAIKSALYHYVTHRIWAAPDDKLVRDIRADIGLPGHVIRWVLS